MNKYTTKPTEITAVKLTEANMHIVFNWARGLQESVYLEIRNGNKPSIVIPNYLMGTTRCLVGDYLVLSKDYGLFTQACKEFESSYSKISADDKIMADSISKKDFDKLQGLLALLRKNKKFAKEIESEIASILGDEIDDFKYTNASDLLISLGIEIEGNHG